MPIRQNSLIFGVRDQLVTVNDKFVPSTKIRQRNNSELNTITLLEHVYDTPLLPLKVRLQKKKQTHNPFAYR